MGKLYTLQVVDEDGVVAWDKPGITEAQLARVAGFLEQHRGAVQAAAGLVSSFRGIEQMFEGLAQYREPPPAPRRRGRK